MPTHTSPQLATSTPPNAVRAVEDGWRARTMGVVTVIVLMCFLAGGGAELTWEFANNEAALCNDFTRAGFFHRNESKKWVIFLESGTLCYSDETCNRRYFQSHIRERYSSDGNRGAFGDFNTTVAWRNTGGAAGLPLVEVVNPLMTSLYCFSNETQHFGNTGTFSLEGRDVLSSDCNENPTFCNHSHVLIPYCSSDMWLLNNDTGTDTGSGMKGGCDCWDRDCFEYKPTGKNQFTFRGRTIFQSVVETVDEMYNLGEAEEILLMGSSVGGVGVLNLAQWVRQEYSNVDISVVVDSSWFVNFRDRVNQEFGALMDRFNISNSSNDTNSSISGILSNIDLTEPEAIQLLLSHEACLDQRLGYPCCFSAQCLLTQSRQSTGVPYYPRDVPVFVINSLYDIFLLSDPLSDLVLFQSDQYSTTALALQFVTTIGEYGGVMNVTILDTAIAVASDLRFSYYATQCFQHTYLATSTLLGDPRTALLGSEIVVMDPEIVTFRHTIESGVWGDNRLAYYEGQGFTIREALNVWYENRSRGFVFRDLCYGPRCNDGCPEELVLQDQGAKDWSTGVKIMIAFFVVAISVICILLKMGCILWLKHLEWRQKRYLASRKSQKDEDIRALTEENVSGNKTEFPFCGEDKAISVACLELHYYVTVGVRVHLKDETAEMISPQTLIGLEPSEVNAGKSIAPVLKKQLGNTRIALVKKKKILNGISAYFNPNELIAIMGPSGCGKTTFLDLLTGRRKTGTLYGDVFVNGIPVEENHNWYLSNTGYVLQLAAPYYEELTVRENLTLAAWVKLHISSREKFERVEQVMAVTGLSDLADTVVGGATGPGLSGGQKRRLVVALQLLKLPSVVFLDEPTSGLDAASSTELLTHLNTLAASNRTVVLTIHQPRLEIFHMFHRIVVLSEGKIAYQGVPEKAYEVFVSALHTHFLKQSLVLPDLGNHNPADVIMDILGNPKMRHVVTNYYEECGEPKLVVRAVAEAAAKEKSYSTDSLDNLPPAVGRVRRLLEGSRRVGRNHNYSIVRLATLEGRAMKRATPVVMLYLPVVFLAYGFLLGTVYYQENTPLLIMSGFSVYSLASSLFLFPALYLYFARALEIYTFEHADGAGRAYDLVIQPFIRFVSMSFFPVVLCGAVLYVLMVDRHRWDFLVFLQVVLTNIALTQVWIAFLMWIILAFPKKAFRLSPIIASVTGFTAGFFIPINDIPWWYRWFSYINPNFYGFSASAVFLLTDFESECVRNGGSEVECYTSSGEYVLNNFDFTNINPYRNIVILMSMTLFFLILAVISNWLRYLSLKSFITKIKVIIKKIRTGESSTTGEMPLEEYHSGSEDDTSEEDEEAYLPTARETSFSEGNREQETEGPVRTTHTSRGVFQFHKSVSAGVERDNRVEVEPCTTPRSAASEPAMRVRTTSGAQRITRRLSRKKSLYLSRGKIHAVWKPRQRSENILSVNAVKDPVKQQDDLFERRRKVLAQIQATRFALDVQKKELAELPETTEVGKKWQRAIKKVIEEESEKSVKQKDVVKISRRFHDIVTQHVEAMSQVQPALASPMSDMGSELDGAFSPRARAQTRVIPVRQWKSQYREGRRIQTGQNILSPDLDTIKEED